MTRRLALTFLWLLGFSVSAHAQVVCGTGPRLDNAKTVAFTPSPDHNATQAVTGTAILDSYRLSVFKVSDGSMVGTPVDLGKPTPVANTIGPLPVIPQSLTKDTLFCLRVDAVGPGGVGVGTPTSPFNFPSVILAPRVVPAAPVLGQ